MKKFVLVLLFFASCHSANNLNSDASYPLGSPLAQLFITRVNAANLVLTNFPQAQAGLSLTISDEGVFSFSEMGGCNTITYRLDSVQNEHHAFFTTPRKLLNGIDTFPAYVGFVFSNGNLYQANYKRLFQTNEDPNIRLRYAKDNIDFRTLVTNNEGKPQAIAVPN